MSPNFYERDSVCQTVGGPTLDVGSRNQSIRHVDKRLPTARGVTTPPPLDAPHTGPQGGHRTDYPDKREVIVPVLLPRRHTTFDLVSGPPLLWHHSSHAEEYQTLGQGRVWVSVNERKDSRKTITLITGKVCRLVLVLPCLL